MPANNVVYTVLTGGYDSLKQPEQITPGWDYLCFSDRHMQNTGIWQVQSIDTGSNPIDQSRRPKIKFFEYLPPCYHNALYVDGNLRLCGDLNQLIHEHFPDGADAASLAHQAWNCLYTEGLAVKRLGKANPNKVNELLARYHEEGLPPNHGLVTAYLLLYRLHNSRSKEFCEQWWQEFQNEEGVKRDQFGLNYLLWKQQPPLNYHAIRASDVRGLYQWIPHGQ